MGLRKRVAVGAGSTMAVCALAVVGVGAASAATGTKPASLASEIAAKFHVSQSDVQKVIDQHQTQTQAERQAHMKTRLDQAVKNGKLTQDQENKIMDEQKQIQSDMQALKDKTGTDRKAAMEAERTKIEQWAKDNSIPLQYLAPFGGRGHHGMGPGMHGPDGDADDGVSPSPAPQA